MIKTEVINSNQPMNEKCKELGKQLMPLEAMAGQIAGMDVDTFKKRLSDKVLVRYIIRGESTRFKEECENLKEFRDWARAKIREFKESGNTAGLKDAIVTYKVISDMWKEFKSDFMDFSLSARMMRQSEKSKDIKDHAHPIVIKYSELDYREMSTNLDKMVREDEKRLLQPH